MSSPKGFVQIFHGMAEHSARYDLFARFLNSEGYIVYANDHRGHGYTLKEHDIPGYLGANGFNNIVDDGVVITRIMKEAHPGLP